MTNSIEDYMKGTKAIPLPPNSQAEAELYNSENEKAIEGQTEAQTKLAIEINKDLESYERKRRYNDEKAQYEANEREIEYNSQQRELDDLDNESAPYNDEDNHLEDDKFTGNYFSQPEDESEPKETLGNRIREKYNSFKALASDTAENLSSSFGESFGAAAGAASAKYSRFKRGDPIFNIQSSQKRSKNPYMRSVTRSNKNISRPYVGGRFGDMDVKGNLNPCEGENCYYPMPQAQNRNEMNDMYLPSGESDYNDGFNDKKAFKRSEFGANENYDPFGFGVNGRLSGDGFNNMSGKFGNSLLGGMGGNSKESSIFGGMSAGTDTVFGDGSMFNANRTSKGKKESGGGMDAILGFGGGMFSVASDAIPTTPQHKKASKIKAKSKKTTKKTATKRRSSTHKQSYNGFVLP